MPNEKEDRHNAFATALFRRIEADGSGLHRSQIVSELVRWEAEIRGSIRKTRIPEYDPAQWVTFQHPRQTDGTWVDAKTQPLTKDLDNIRGFRWAKSTNGWQNRPVNLHTTVRAPTEREELTVKCFARLAIRHPELTVGVHPTRSDSVDKAQVLIKDSAGQPLVDVSLIWGIDGVTAFAMRYPNLV